MKRPRLKEEPKGRVCEFLEGPMDGERLVVKDQKGLEWKKGKHVYWRETVESATFLYMGWGEEAYRDE